MFLLYQTAKVQSLFLGGPAAESIWLQFVICESLYQNCYFHIYLVPPNPALAAQSSRCCLF